MSFELTKSFILPTIIALFLAYIAWQQMRINDRKLRLDLYNKRFEIYTDTLKFYQELIGEELTKETHLKFVNSKEAALFLFSSDPEIYKILDEIHARSFKITGFKKNNKSLTGAPDIMMEAYKEMEQALSWIMAKAPVLQKRFKKFLSL